MFDRMTRFEAITISLFHFERERGYPPKLAKYVPSIVIRHKTYVDTDLDRKWRDKYATIRSKDKRLKWLEARLTERRIISKVSLLLPLFHRRADVVSSMQWLVSGGFWSSVKLV